MHEACAAWSELDAAIRALDDMAGEKRRRKQAAASRVPATVVKSVEPPLPAWRRLASAIAADIAADGLTEGAQLPSESALARRFESNRHTVRRALGHLAHQGMIRLRPHSPPIVAPLRIPIPLAGAARFTDALRSAGYAPGGRLISSSIGTAPARVATLLKLAARTPVVEVKHLLLANDRPVGFVTSWSPADRFARLAEYYEKTSSMRDAFDRLGVTRYIRRSGRISSRPGDSEECKQLGLKRGGNMLVICTVNIDGSGEPIHVANYRFAADRVEFLVEG